MKPKLRDWLYVLAFIAAMAIACEPARLYMSEDANADASTHYLYAGGGEEGFDLRRIYPPVRVQWASSSQRPEQLVGDCYTTGGLVEVTHESIVIVQSQWPLAGYMERQIIIPWDEVISAYNYEVAEELERPDPQ